MNWKDVATNDLRCLDGLRSARSSLSEKMAVLASKLDGVKGIQFRVDPTPGGFSPMEDRLLSGIVELDELTRQRENVSRTISIIESGFKPLTEDEALALEYFYVDRRGHTAELLMERLYLSRAGVYRLRDRAVRKYVLYRYGLLES